jgi:hypothetical protein
MENYDNINQYDLVEVIHVPEEYEDVIDIGDIGVVVEKYDDENFEIECVNPGGSYKWLETLNIKYVRLRSKDPYNPWIEKSLTDKPIMQKSILLGMALGAIFGGMIGVGLGAITATLNGILVGLVIGLILGVNYWGSHGCFDREDGWQDRRNRCWLFYRHAIWRSFRDDPWRPDSYVFADECTHRRLACA